MRAILLLLAILLIKSCTTPQWESIEVVPLPKKYEIKPGVFHLKNNASVSVQNPELINVAEVLIADVRKIAAVTLNKGNEKEAIQLKLNEELGPEQYQLQINDKITISGGSLSAVVHGMSTLIQLGKEQNGMLEFPHINIEDEPAFPFRALMLDVARQKTEFSTLLQAVDLCRLHKVNYLQIHFSDNEAFTFPSTHYPQIVTKQQSYTLEQMNHLAAFAADRGVIIIPEIDGPGHSQSIRAALSEVFGAEDFSVLDMSSDTMYAAMAIIFSELNAVFDPPYFHIGADEASLNKAYLKDAQVSKYMKGKGFDDEDMKREYVVKMDRRIKALGKKTMAWESFKASNEKQKVKIPKDILMNAWETLYELPQNYIREGFEIINTSWKPYYTVRMHRWRPQYIYEFNPTQFANHWIYAPSYNSFEIAPSTQIKGGQMCAWEQFDVQQIAGLRSRIPAFAESYWLGDQKPGYADFERRVTKSDRVFEKIIAGAAVEISGNYLPIENTEIWNGATLPNPAGLQNNYAGFFDQKVTLKIIPNIAGSVIRYTLDASEPDLNAAVYSEPITISKSTHFRMKVFDKNDKEIGYQQYLFEHRPIHAKLVGLEKSPRAIRPFFYNQKYTESLQIAFHSNVTALDIRYTTDASEPTMQSKLYETPFQIDTTAETTVRARAFKDGIPFGDEWRPSDYYDYLKIWPPSQFYHFGKVEASSSPKVLVFNATYLRDSDELKVNFEKYRGAARFEIYNNKNQLLLAGVARHEDKEVLYGLSRGNFLLKITAPDGSKGEQHFIKN